jgi:hypothetical protein
MGPEFVGTLPGWITAISSTGGVAAVIIALLRRNVSLRGLQNADHADIRDHYAEELERVIERQHGCEAREEKLRERVTELENDVLGLIRIIAQASADKVLLLDTEDIPPSIKKMAERIAGRGPIV